jgi:2-keto-4-pentenoate hydratase/2-oxohepta-3-ene-1,7-dioic acid hydratase in catechol pathway
LRGTPPQFSLAKSHPGSGPIGPVAVTPDAVADPAAVAFDSVLIGADGGREVVQTGNTADMIFPVDDLVSRLSRVCTLLPGDLIFTGTPAGVGNRRSPPRFLQPGETLVSRVDGVGEIRQTFVAA